MTLVDLKQKWKLRNTEISKKILIFWFFLEVNDNLTIIHYATDSDLFMIVMNSDGEYDNKHKNENIEKKYIHISHSEMMIFSFDLIKRGLIRGKCSWYNFSFLAKVRTFLQECNSFKIKTTKKYRFLSLILM